MVNYLKIVSLLICSLFVFESSNLIAGSKKKPKWASNRPVDSNYYIGIGKSSKTESNAEYMQIAKSNANICKNLQQFNFTSI